jgi:LPXTG-site transpeptidase (sortase) family protein
MERKISGTGGLNESKVEAAPLSRPRSRVNERLALFLSGVGLLLLVYVCGQYWQMYASQRKLALEWQEQNARLSNIPGNDNDNDSGALTRLTIAKIKLDAVIVEGTSRQSLKLGPGHMEDSALPGYSGNAVIVAHRDTFFRHLNELQAGDEIDLRQHGEVYRFEVTERRIVEPQDLSALRRSPTAQLTLITCYPTHYVGPAPQRLVVVARLMARNQTAADVPPSQ